MKKPRLGVLGSGKGSNYVAIAEAVRSGKLDAEIVLVASDFPDAGILGKARKFGHPAHYAPPGPFRTKMTPEAEEQLALALQEAGTDLVILAGFMRVIKEPLLTASDRILNIHPSLLPAFKGLEAWRQALEARVSEAGCTVHLVNAQIDGGQILAQARVPVFPDDTPASLHARIQAEEHIIFPKAIGDYWVSLQAD